MTISTSQQNAIYVGFNPYINSQLINYLKTKYKFTDKQIIELSENKKSKYYCDYLINTKKTNFNYWDNLTTENSMLNLFQKIPFNKLKNTYNTKRFQFKEIIKNSKINLNNYDRFVQILYPGKTLFIVTFLKESYNYFVFISTRFKSAYLTWCKIVGINKQAIYLSNSTSFFAAFIFYCNSNNLISESLLLNTNNNNDTILIQVIQVNNNIKFVSFSRAEMQQIFKSFKKDKYQIRSFLANLAPHFIIWNLLWNNKNQTAFKTGKRLNQKKKFFLFVQLVIRFILLVENSIIDTKTNDPRQKELFFHKFEQKLIQKDLKPLSHFPKIKDIINYNDIGCSEFFKNGKLSQIFGLHKTLNWLNASNQLNVFIETQTEFLQNNRTKRSFTILQELDYTLNHDRFFKCQNSSNSNSNFAFNSVSFYDLINASLNDLSSSEQGIKLTLVYLCQLVIESESSIDTNLQFDHLLVNRKKLDVDQISLSSLSYLFNTNLKLFFIYLLYIFCHLKLNDDFNNFLDNSLIYSWLPSKLPILIRNFKNLK